MAKNAYLVASDLHKSYRNLANRIDYRAEVAVAEEHLLRTAEKYKQLGYNPVLLLLGDVFHNSYNDVIRAVLDNNFFVLWEKLFGQIYTVIGNHELSYYSSNPFFTLVNRVESERLQKITDKVWQPVGLLPIINVVDRLEDGDVVFHFNHYGTGVAFAEDGKVNIGLFHQDIVSTKIVADAQDMLGYTIFSKPVDFDNLTVFDGYSYCFFGHMHSIYGIYRTDSGCILDYLASLGRTNVREVNDKFLERDVPVVLIEDGKLVRVEQNTFMLPSRAESVNELEVKKAQESYEIQKVKEAVKSYVPISDDPLTNLRGALANNVLALDLIDELKDNEIDSLGLQILGKVGRI